jgi:hypothetical protein
MEPPKSWNRLTASLAVSDLSQPFKAWAFLVLQGLVRDLPGDRENFLRFVQQEKTRNITGPSLASRVARLIEQFGFALPESHISDPEAVIALQRLQMIAAWQPDGQASGASIGAVFCIHCGYRFDVEQHSALCPKCNTILADRSATVGKPCPSCRELNLLMAIFCEYCGRKFPVAESPPEPRPPILEPKGWWSESRLFRLAANSENPKDLAQKQADLFSVVLSVIQDFATIKSLLQQKGVWDEGLYKELRIKRMIYDHSSAGTTPWKGYSHYPYTLDESDFLRQILRASDDEVKQFEEDAQAASECT